MNKINKMNMNTNMNSRLKTKKRVKRNKLCKKNTARLCRGYIYGGDSNSDNASDIEALKNEKAADELQKKIAEDHSLTNLMPSFNLGESKLMNVATNLTEMGIEQASGLVGIDLTNDEQTNLQLSKMKDTLSDPANQEQIKEIAQNASKIGLVALEAAEPFAEPLIKETVDKLKIAGNELGEAGVKILLNTAEEIPGVGVAIGTARSLDTAAQAALSTINTSSEIITATSDSINGAIQNFNRLIKEKGELADRTSKSINDFTNKSAAVATNAATNAATKIPKIGGKFTKKYKSNRNKYKYNNKTRRY
jgi:hypothetical protein